MVVGPAWRHPTTWGIVGALIAAPTLLFIIGSLLAYQGGNSTVAGWMNGVTSALASAKLLDLALVAAPVVALVAATLPLLRIERKQDRAGEMSLAIRTLRLNVAIAATAAVLVLIVLAYGVSDWLFAAAR